MHFIRNSALSGLAAIHLAAAQTYTTCNPTEKTCPNDTGLNSASFACDFTQGKSALASWSTAAGTTITYDDTKGAGFTINGKNQAPTISTDFYIFFGKVEVTMQAAPGTGIVSSMVLQSEDLDEIDWEWLGGDTTQAQTNYFGKGNTTSYDRGTYQSVSSPQTGMHTYAFDWSPSKIDWLIDGVVVRTVNYADAVGGQNFPQTPMRLKLGNWVAGDPATNAPGTVMWAGGNTDFSKAPFVMYVKSVSMTNYNPAAEYQWTDKTGSYKSIKLVGSSSSPDSAPSPPVSGSASKTVIIKSTGVISDVSNTVAPTSAISVKKAQAEGSAAVIPPSGNTTLSSMIGGGTATTLSSMMGGGTASVTSAAGSKKTMTSAVSSSGSSSTQSGKPAQQTSNVGATNVVGGGLVSVIGAAMAYFVL